MTTSRTDRPETFADAGILPADVVTDRRADGTIIARSPHALRPYARALTTTFEAWASAAPDRTFLAKRDASGAWRHLTYADTWRRVRSVAEALLARGLGPTRTIVIASGNGLEHQILALAAMVCGVPYAPVAPTYSLAVRDHGTLRWLIDRMQPGLLFADDGERFEPALSKVLGPEIELVTVTPPGTLRATSFSALEATTATSAVDTAHAAVGPDTIAKVLFTSGSTGRPKGVINTQRMLCSNLEQIRTVLRFLEERPPVLCDWLPWNHTFGGNHNVGIALYNGGTLYIDDGRPVPGAYDTTIKNLRDIRTTGYFNVPKGYEMLWPYLRNDEAFRRHFFAELRVLFYAAAGIRRETAEAFQAMAIETTGHPIPWVTGLGATESSPSAMFTGPLLTPVAEIGVPVAGLELKATPVDDRFEARVKGPNVTPGYWRDDDLTRSSFDDEGYYKMGDAIVPVDSRDLSKGFTFQGRLTEDFKLSTGTWVRVGALRARLLAVAGDLISDVVIAAPDRDRVTALLFPNLVACRALASLGATAPSTAVMADPAVRAAIEMRLAAFNAGDAGSSTSIGRAKLLSVPPSIDAAEITDKGSLNQRAVLTHRAADVDALYAATSTGLLI
jgi:feruloyl-CoA synthase